METATAKGLQVGILHKINPLFQIAASVYPGASLDFLIAKVMESSHNLKNNDVLLLIGGTNDVPNNYNFDVKSKLNTVY